EPMMTMYMAGPYAPGDSSAPPFPYRETFPASPFRRPDWRWIVAQYHVENARRLWPPWDDPWTRSAVHSMRNSSPLGQRESAGFEKTREAIRLTGQLREMPNPFFRIELEARLLTGETCEQVAQRCDLDPATVEAYEHLFYDVRAKLKYRSCVMRELIGPKLYLGFSLADVEVLWKLVAVQGGNLLLDAIMDVGWVLERPARLNEVAQYFAQNADAGTARQLYLHSLVLPGRNLSPKEVVQLLDTLEQLEAETACRPLAGSSYNGTSLAKHWDAVDRTGALNRQESEVPVPSRSPASQPTAREVEEIRQSGLSQVA
ncbi:MAG: hypothetical protein AB7V46_07685, partial [Thermomicrobiales bacterium]